MPQAEFFVLARCNHALHEMDPRGVATAVAELAPKLKAAGAATVVLAGNPGQSEAAYRSAGVDRFIYVRCDVLETLWSLLHAEEARS